MFPNGEGWAVDAPNTGVLEALFVDPKAGAAATSRKKSWSEFTQRSKQSVSNHNYPK